MVDLHLLYPFYRHTKMLWLHGSDTDRSIASFRDPSRRHLPLDGLHPYGCSLNIISHHQRSRKRVNDPLPPIFLTQEKSIDGNETTTKLFVLSF